MKAMTNLVFQEVWLALCAALLTTNVCAQDQVTPSDMAKELHNPLSNLREVIFQLDVLPNVGPGSKADWATTVQPVWPFALGDGWKVVTKLIGVRVKIKLWAELGSPCCCSCFKFIFTLTPIIIARYEASASCSGVFQEACEY